MVLGKRLTLAAVCLTGLQSGIIYTWPCGLFAQMIDGTAQFSLSSQEQIFIINTMTVFKLIGSALTAYLMEKHGRRMALINLPSFIDSTVVWFCLAEAFHGLFINVSASVMPIFIAETMEANIRGAVSILTSAAVTLGTIVTSALGATNYYLYVGVPVIPSVLMMSLVLVLKETPYFSMVKEGKDKARESFIWIRGHYDEEDLVRIEESVILLNTRNKGVKGYKELLRRNTRKSLGIVVLFALLATVSGYDTVNSLLPIIIPKSSINSTTAVLLMSISGLCGTLFSMFLIDRVGRKPLTFISFLGTDIAFILVSIWYYLHDQTAVNTESTLWIPLVLFVTVSLFSHFGSQHLYHIFIGELFSVNLSGRASMIVTIATALSLILFNQAFYPIRNAVGMANTMLICGGFNIIGCICVCMFLIETKGKTLEEIQNVISKKDATIQNL